jgi:Na+/proline symporter
MFEKLEVLKLTITTVSILLAGWIIFLAFLGNYVARASKIKGADQYLTAGRNVHWGLITTSVVAAYLWSATLMASAEGAYGFGAAGIWIYGIGYGAGLAFFGLAANRLRSIFPNGTTVYQFVRLRFDNKTQIFWAICSVAFSLVTIVIQLIGAGIAIQTFTGGQIPFWVGPILMSLAVLVYIIGAGIWSSIVADFIMVCVGVLAALWLAPWTISQAGGLAHVFEAFQARVVAEGAYEMANFFRSDALLNYLVPVLAWSMLSLWLQQEYWQKTFASNPKTLRKSYALAGFWWAMIPIAAGVVGLAGWALSISVDVASDIYPTMIVTFLPTWVQSIFLLMVFAAVTSTVASSFLAVSTIFVTDIYYTHINKNASSIDLTKITRIGIVVVAVIATILSFQKLSILNLLLFMSLLLAAPAPVMIIGMVSKRLAPNPAFFISIVGMAIGLYIYFFTGLGLGVAILSASGFSLIMSLLSSAIYDYDFDFTPLKDVGKIGKDI